MKKISYQEFLKIKSEYTGNPSVFNWWLMKHYNELYKDIMSYGNFYTLKKINFENRIIWYFCDIHNYPLCKICGKPNTRLPSIKLINDYINNPDILNYCKSHYYSSDYYQNKMKFIYLQKYGVDNPNKLKEVKDKVKKTLIEHYGSSGLKSEQIRNKIKQTCLEKYGVEYIGQSNQVKIKIHDTFITKYNGHPLRNSDIKNKQKQTFIDHFGCDHPMKNDYVKQKVKNSCYTHYGVNSPLQCNEIKEKYKKSIIQKYGVDNISKLQEIKDKKIDSCIKHYNVKYSFQSNKVKEKIKETNIQKYGVNNPSQNKDIHKKQVDSIKKITYKKSFERLSKGNGYIKLISNWDEFIDYKNKKINYLKWKCLKCNSIIDSKQDSNNGCFCRCYKCYPYELSMEEIKLHEYINSFINVKMISRNRSLLNGKELDIYIPSNKLAIEFDGLYWHSERFQFDNYYHLNKTEDCEKQDIQLIHIFEDEWVYKQDIVKARIRNLLGVYDKIVYARKCEVKEIKNNDEVRDFLNMNHIQGNCNSLIKYGLFYENELVSLMTFGKYRKALGRESVDNEYEMLRFCNKLGYHIPGAASKLFKHFVKDYQPSKVISYADRRWSKGNLYQKLGFQLIRKTEPNYWYIIDGKREFRFKWRKSELPKLLENFDENLSEYENMLNNGYYRIFDCGSLLYEINFT